MTPAQKKAERAWSEFIRRRAGGRCEHCGLWGPVEAAHVIRRGRSWITRCHPDNGRGLCHTCHARVDRHATPWLEWEDIIGPEALEDLRRLVVEAPPYVPAGHWETAVGELS